MNSTSILLSNNRMPSVKFKLFQIGRRLITSIKLKADFASEVTWIKTRIGTVFNQLTRVVCWLTHARIQVITMYISMLHYKR